jgi:predicted TIM-barrel fold metal-dependent hydrolase
VISLSPPGVFFGDQGLADELARLVNERTAEHVRAAPGRFAGLAVLPLPNVDRALAELRHALDDLGLDGVTLLSNVAGTYLGDPAWDPLFDELDRRGAYVFLHPTAAPGPPPLPEHPIWLYEFPFDTTRAVANLVYSGTLERCPRIRLQVSHLGGTAPFLAHRLASLEAREPDRAARAPAGALAYLRRLYYDTGLSNHDLPARPTLDLAGPERIVFGTDWPYADLPPEGDPAPGLDGLGPDLRARIDAANAAVLVPRLASALDLAAA